jgi:low affinity Fe/Cu permease
MAQAPNNGSHPFSAAFAHIANSASHAAGRATTFILALGVVIVWAHYSAFRTPGSWS